MKTSESVGVEVLRQALVSLARDGGKRKGPAEAEGTVAGAGVIGKRQLRPEARTARAWWRMGTVIEPVPVTGLAANFSPMPRIAPPPFGRVIDGAVTPNFSAVGHTALITALVGPRFCRSPPPLPKNNSPKLTLNNHFGSMHTA